MKRKVSLSLLLIFFIAGCSGIGPATTVATRQPPPGESTEAALNASDGKANMTETVTPEVVETEALNTSSPTPENTSVVLQTVSPFSGESVIGIEMHEINPNGGLQLVEQANAYWVRRNALLWSTVELSPGNYQWTNLKPLEDEMAAASEAGLRLVLIIRSTPPWAQKVPGYLCGPIAPDALDEFSQFMFELVSRYSQAPFNVKMWEIWNEPDIKPGDVVSEEIFGCWGEADTDFYGGRYFAEMLKNVYPMVKKADPEAEVLIGGLVLDCDPNNPPETEPGSGKYKDCQSTTFLEGILSNAGKDYFDGVSFHAYDYYYGEEGKYGNTNWHSASQTGPVMREKVKYIRNLLETYEASSKFIINSETAILCGQTGKETECQTEAFQNTKAYYSAITNATAIADGLRANIWYSIYGWRASDLAANSTTPYPVMKAIEFSAQMLENATFVRKLADYPGILGYEFVTDRGHLWFLWGIADAPSAIQLPDEPLAMYNVFGEAIPVNKMITVGVNPVYLEFP